MTSIDDKAYAERVLESLRRGQSVAPSRIRELVASGQLEQKRVDEARGQGTAGTIGLYRFLGNVTPSPYYTKLQQEAARCVTAGEA